MRSEGDDVLRSVDELIEISRRANAPAQIYHLKLAGRENWGRIDDVIRRVEAARAQGLRVSANMYTYTAGATGLDAAMPLWVQAGGHEQWRARLRDPAIRARVAAEMRQRGQGWENLLYGAGAEHVLLNDFRNPALRRYTGMTLAAVAQQRGVSPEEAAMDLVIEDDSRVGAIYFLMSEDNVRRQIRLPWVSFGSDAGSIAPEGLFLNSNPHPRTYGNVARLLGRYVREERLIPLQEAVRRLTSWPAEQLGIRERGSLRAGNYADLAIFDPATITDHATFERPHQYATGMRHVFVNGTQVLRDGEHTGATPGRVVRGPGWNRCRPA
jgi:N-acyl-D-amino-acid deacylase